MTSGVKPIPEGYHSITPYLVVNDAAGAIEFYKSVFGASELMRMAAPGGRVGHAEIRIGDSRIMLADEFPEMGARSARTIGGSPVHIYLYVEDVDAVTGKALARRREGAAPGQGPVLRRPFGQHRRSFRPRLARLDPQGGRAARRAQAARR
jgi:PhnB protein